ncbi:MAG: AAA family ATPase [Deltaproteobacteria bacterium]|jgi:hypothetical protein|nr:AAA family ATPase [Deltaproteobacteria bacterium]
MKRLPLGVQSFPEIIEQNYVYADKTRFIHEILSFAGKTFFLARPSRFGKTLLLSAFEALFSGRKDLFDGLWIGENAKTQGSSNNAYNLEESFPIINLNFASFDFDSPQILEAGITHRLKSIARSYDLNIDAPTLPALFAEFIRNLKRKYQKNVVLLIDEYDAPVSGNIDDLELAQKNARVLKNFYASLKPLIKDLRFVFITGITSYAMLWRIPALNHVINLTMDKRFSTVCGFTHEEMDSCFKDYYPIALEKFKNSNSLGPNDAIAEARQKILDMYDGYSWDGIKKVLNPHSLLYFFYNNQFQRYWADMDSPSKLITDFVLQNPLYFARETLSTFGSEKLEMADPNYWAPEPLLFQKGYLTLDKIVQIPNHFHEYRLRIPNAEIDFKFKSEFTQFLFETLNTRPDDEKEIFTAALFCEDAEKISAQITANLRKIISQSSAKVERVLHGALFFYFYGLPDVEVLFEPAGADTPPDLVVKFDDGLYVIIELKFQYAKKDSLTKRKIKEITRPLARQGLKDIEDINYGAPYMVGATKIHKLGLGIYGEGHCLALLKTEKRTA